jgi:cation transport ATPase
MKKLHNKMFKEKQETEEENISLSSPTTCSCCNEINSSQSTATGEREYEIHGHTEEKHKNFFNEKLLIIMGLVLTIPIVLLEIAVPHTLASSFIMIGLATPVQVLLGNPFYIRFFKVGNHDQFHSLITNSKNHSLYI